jgi:hypothetical protein
VASDMDRRAPLVFSPTHTPDVSVVDAVVASCTIPLVFSRRTYQGRRVIDGAFTDPYPVHLCANTYRTLGLLQFTSPDLHESYATAAYTLPIYQLKQIAMAQWEDCPAVYTLTIESRHFAYGVPTLEQRHEMLAVGAAAVGAVLPPALVAAPAPDPAAAAAVDGTGAPTAAADAADDTGASTAAAATDDDDTR